MPACFTLTPIGTNEPATLQSIDDAMRVHFGAPPDTVNWYENWYEFIGYALAMGKDWNSIRTYYPRPEYNEVCDIVDWLEANYVPNQWYQHQR